MFTIFPDLPTELRLEIWNFALLIPRLVIVELDSEGTSIRTKLKPASNVLLANRESNYEAVRYYTYIKLGNVHIPFNNDLDMLDLSLMFEGRIPFHLFSTKCIIKEPLLIHFLPEIRAYTVKNLGIDYADWRTLLRNMERLTAAEGSKLDFLYNLDRLVIRQLHRGKDQEYDVEADLDVSPRDGVFDTWWLQKQLPELRVLRSGHLRWWKLDFWLDMKDFENFFKRLFPGKDVPEISVFGHK